MKTFAQLNSQEKTQAVRRAIDLLLGLLVDGVVEAKLAAPRNRLKLKTILHQNRKNETPMLAKEQIMQDATLRPEIEEMAVEACKRSRYDDEGNVIMENKKENL